MTIDELLTKYRAAADSEIEKGAKFERLMKNFLLTYPVYDGIIDKVWLWKDFPFRADFGEHDLGIDLVAQTFEGELWAVQCKFYAEDTTIEKAAVDSFISSSARIVGGKKFSKRIFISTSSNFSKNAKEMLENQTPPVIQIDMSTLRNAAVDWEQLDAGNFGKVAVIQRNLRDYQKDAIAAAHEHFKNNSRGKLIMACGTGKTFTALKIAEDLTEGRGFILYLVPSLSLMGQTLNEWASFAEKPFNTLLVCSDETVTKKAVEEDTVERVNLPISPTNDPQKIFDELKKFHTDRMTVIFSTYQSIEKVIAAQEKFKTPFDLVICDEAHRTAGNSQKDKEARLFSLVHKNENINAARRMYMTATPKLYSESLKNKAQDNNIFVWSMDDENIFGAEFYRISFKRAIELDCLSDYKLLLFAVSESEIQSNLRDEIFKIVEDYILKEYGKTAKEMKLSFDVDDIAKLVGTINAMSKRVTDDSKELLEGDLKPMNKAVAFLPKIANSKVTAKILETVENLYRASLKESERAKLIDITANHVDGSSTSGYREEILNDLKKTPADRCKIISNVRCLSEGVDVPSLDAVIFLTPKKSKVDIVQAVGRALRKAAEKNFGYVIVPIIVPSNVNGEVKQYFEENNEKYQTIYEVARMLGAHDDAMNVEIERLNASGKSSKIKIIRTPEFDASQTNLPFEIFQTELIAQVVNHAGNRNYWRDWASKVSVIVQRHTEEIKKLIEQKDSPQAAAFNQFLADLHKIINPAITADEAVDMLAQHLVTRPVFEALFDNFSFVQNNPVSKSMTQILYQLDKTGLENDRAELQSFYDNVKESCKNMGDAKNRQKIIVSLYDSFFKMALPQTVERLGIVYTPPEVVDFILNSVNDVLQKEFNRTVSSENVHVLDPFSGTGTFLTRLIESGLIQPADLLRKYQSELHANEIVLLAYYISAINIENSFHSFLGNREQGIGNSAENPTPYSLATIPYIPFNGVCLTDTFQTYENAKKPEAYLTGFENPLRENSALIKKQLDTKIEIIVGNPPYSVGQKSANDNNQNVHYTKLEKRIAETYAAKTAATNKNSLYDSYIKAFRWAADRIKDSGGIIGFVTNAGWLDGAAMDGLRKSFAQEFSSIYVFNLRGNQRTQGETSRKEGGKIFGSGSRAPIAITILVKNPEVLRDAAEIFYLEVEDYLSRDQKLKKIQAVHSVLSDEFKILTPNDKGDWINQRGNIFEKFILIGDKKNNSPQTFFVNYSPGLKTQRDTWCYNFSKFELAKNIQTTIDFYNESSVENVDEKNFVWTDLSKSNKRRNVKYIFDSKKIIATFYRPFCKQYLYYDENLNDRRGQFPKFFPTGKEKNLLICMVSGDRNFSVFITDKITDVQFQFNGQCFPLYWYEAARLGNLFTAGQKEYTRRDGVTEYILERARLLHGAGVSKEDIFYYVYGFLHLPAYREEFAADLKKSLPRLVMVASTEKFLALSRAGRALAEIHLNYEKQEPPSGVEVIGAESGNFAVTKLRLSKDKTELYYNKDITIKNIPARAFEYVVNGRSPLEWIIDRYQIKTDKASQITNNPNDWCAEHNQPRYILDLILSCITVSLKTLEIVENLPEVNFE